MIIKLSFQKIKEVILILFFFNLFFIIWIYKKILKYENNIIFSSKLNILIFIFLNNISSYSSSYYFNLHLFSQNIFYMLYNVVVSYLIIKLQFCLIFNKNYFFIWNNLITKEYFISQSCSFKRKLSQRVIFLILLYSKGFKIFLFLSIYLVICLQITNIAYKKNWYRSIYWLSLLNHIIKNLEWDSINVCIFHWIL